MLITGAVLLNSCWASRIGFKEIVHYSNDIVVSPSGGVLAASDSEGPIKLYRRVNGGWSQYKALPATIPEQLVFNRKGSVLVWTDGYGLLSVWMDGHTTCLQGNNPWDPRHEILSYSVSTSGSRLAIGRLDGLQLINLTTMKNIFYDHSQKSVSAIAFDVGGNLYVGGKGLHILRHNQLKFTAINDVTERIQCIEPEPNGNVVATLNDHCDLVLYDLHIPKRHLIVWRGKGQPEGLAWSQDSKMLAILTAADEKHGEPSQLNRIVVFESSGWKKVASIELPSSAVGDLAFNLNGSNISCSVADTSSVGGTYYWSTKSWKPIKPFNFIR